jgi:hypothetical protein
MVQNPNTDDYDVVHVNVEADTAQEAIESSAMTRGSHMQPGKPITGRWFAFPNEYFNTFMVRIAQVSDVNITPEGSQV